MEIFAAFPCVRATEPSSASLVLKARVEKESDLGVVTVESSRRVKARVEKKSDLGVVTVKSSRRVRALNTRLMSIQMSSNLLHPFVSFVSRRVAKYAKAPNIKFYANRNNDAYILFGLESMSPKRATLKPLFVPMLRCGKVLRVSKTHEQPRDAKNIHLNFGTFEHEGRIKKTLEGIFSGRLAIATTTPRFTSSNSTNRRLPILKFANANDHTNQLRRVFVLSLKHRTVSHGTIQNTDWEYLLGRANRDPRPVKSSNHDFTKERRKSRLQCTCVCCRDKSSGGRKIKMLASEQKYVEEFHSATADIVKKCLERRA